LLEVMREMAKSEGINFEIHQNERATAHKTMMSSLLNKNGKEFDKAYLDHELKFSQDFVKALKESLIPNTHDQEFRVFLSATLARFEEHLSHINHAAMMLNSDNDKVNKVNHDHKHQ